MCAQCTTSSVDMPCTYQLAKSAHPPAAWSHDLTCLLCRMRREEREECARMHDIIDKYNLHGRIRWIEAQKDRVRNGELYRWGWTSIMML